MAYPLIPPPTCYCATFGYSRSNSVGIRTPKIRSAEFYPFGMGVWLTLRNTPLHTVYMKNFVVACQRVKQVAQLMLTNPRDAFRGRSRLPNSTIPYVRYSFLLV